MKKSFMKMIEGYHAFREKYVHSDNSVMQSLSYYGQQPEIMIVACCDSRVDPALILQCAPGDLFVARNVANIVPPYEKDEAHHGTSAALEFAVCALKVKHLILLGHSQCGGIQARLDSVDKHGQDDFITNWVSLINIDQCPSKTVDECAKSSLHQSYANCFTFPWIQEQVDAGKLIIHRWFFDIKAGQIFSYCEGEDDYRPL